MENLLLVVFTVLYLLGDMLYVYSSKSFYGKVVQEIQGAPLVLKPTAYVGIVLSYIFLAAGWAYLIAKRVTPTTRYTDVVLMAGIYGLAVYGVFNTTLYVTFTNWNSWVALRDTLWGVGWILLVSLVYTYVSKSKTPLFSR